MNMRLYKQMGRSVCRLPVFVFSALVALSMVAAPEKKERSYLDTTWWDPHVENITDTDTYLRRKFRQDVTDRSTGLSSSAIKRELSGIVAAGRSVRVCGWNVRWNDLSKEEQDAYIIRAERIMK